MKELTRGFSRREAMMTGAALAAGAGLTTEALAQNGGAEARLKALDITLPVVQPPVANYVPFKKVGNLIFVAGQVPFKDGKILHPGRVPTDVSIDQAKEAARQCAINMLAVLRLATGGSLDAIKECVRLEGFVASDPSFTAQPAIINGASDLMVSVFGDAGRHARIAVGSPSLPLNSAVELAGYFAI